MAATGIDFRGYQPYTAAGNGNNRNFSPPANTMWAERARDVRVIVNGADLTAGQVIVGGGEQLIVYGDGNGNETVRVSVVSEFATPVVEFAVGKAPVAGANVVVNLENMRDELREDLLAEQYNPARAQRLYLRTLLLIAVRERHAELEGNVSASPYYYYQEFPDMPAPAIAANQAIADGGYLVEVIPKQMSSGGLLANRAFITFLEGTVKARINVAGVASARLRVKWVFTHFLSEVALPAGAPALSDLVSDDREDIINFLSGNEVSIKMPSFNSVYRPTASSTGAAALDKRINIRAQLKLEVLQIATDAYQSGATIAALSFNKVGATFSQLANRIGDGQAAQGANAEELARITALETQAANLQAAINGIVRLPGTSGAGDGSVPVWADGAWRIFQRLETFVANTTYWEGQIVRIDSAGNGGPANSVWIAESDRNDAAIANNAGQPIVAGAWLRIDSVAALTAAAAASAAASANATGVAANAAKAAANAAAIAAKRSYPAADQTKLSRLPFLRDGGNSFAIVPQVSAPNAVGYDGGGGSLENVPSGIGIRSLLWHDPAEPDTDIQNRLEVAFNSGKALVNAIEIDGNFYTLENNPSDPNALRSTNARVDNPFTAGVKSYLRFRLAADNSYVGDKGSFIPAAAANMQLFTDDLIRYGGDIYMARRNFKLPSALSASLFSVSVSAGLLGILTGDGVYKTGGQLVSALSALSGNARLSFNSLKDNTDLAYRIAVGEWDVGSGTSTNMASYLGNTGELWLNNTEKAGGIYDGAAGLDVNKQYEVELVGGSYASLPANSPRKIVGYPTLVGSSSSGKYYTFGASGDNNIAKATKMQAIFGTTTINSGDGDWKISEVIPYLTTPALPAALTTALPAALPAAFGAATTDWAAGVHPVGKRVRSDGATWECIAARTASNTAKPLKDRQGWSKVSTELIRQVIRGKAGTATNIGFANFDLGIGFSFADYERLQFCFERNVGSNTPIPPCYVHYIDRAEFDGTTASQPRYFVVAVSGTSFVAVGLYKVDNNTVAMRQYGADGDSQRVGDIIGIR